MPRIGILVAISVIVVARLLTTHEEEQFTSERVFIAPAEIQWLKMRSALIEVESRGDSLAVGKTNDAGILQITPIYVEEVNRIIKKELYNLDDRFSKIKSLEMFEIYQNYYNPDRCIIKAIKLHNPRAGEWYLNKVLKEML